MSSLGAVSKSDQHMERRSRLLWIGLIAGFFLVHGSMMIVGIVLATRDPTHAVIPNYHQQAMEYDKVLADRQASERLGWKWSITLESGHTTSSTNSFIVQLRDTKGQPVVDAQVAVDLCHHARGNQHRRVRLLPVTGQPGQYRGETRLDRSGVWQIDLDVQRGVEHFIDRQEKFWSLS